jgi:hypothetical protein
MPSITDEIVHSQDFLGKENFVVFLVAFATE